MMTSPQRVGFSTRWDRTTRVNRRTPGDQLRMRIKKPHCVLVLELDNSNESPGASNAIDLPNLRTLNPHQPITQWWSGQRKRPPHREENMVIAGRLKSVVALHICPARMYIQRRSSLFYELLAAVHHSALHDGVPCEHRRAIGLALLERESVRRRPAHDA